MMLSKNGSANEIQSLNLLNLTENQILELAIAALKKQSSQRTPEDIILLKKATENNTFFSTLIEKYGEETYSMIFQHLTYQYLEPDSVLFEAGSIGTTFYILLKGSVGVIIKMTITLEDGTFDYDFKEVKVLNTGDSFGELAIMEDVIKPRAATIKSKEECHLVCLNRASYKKVLGLHQKRELDAKIEFLSSIPVFKSWSNHSLKTLTYLISIKNMSTKQVIYKEGDSVEEIYIIRSGEVKSLKTIKINHKEKETEQLIIDEQNQIYTYLKDPLKKSVEIAVMTAGQIFGEEEAYLMYKKEKLRERRSKLNIQKDESMPSTANSESKSIEEIFRETTVVIYSQQAEIWAIHKKNFFQKLEPYAASHNILATMINAKAQWRNERLGEITKSASNNINYLIGNSPIKPRPSAQNDIITTIKFKHFTKNQNQTIVKSNPLDIEMLQNEAYNLNKDTKYGINIVGTTNNANLNNDTSYDHLSTTENLENIDGLSFYGKMSVTNRSKSALRSGGNGNSVGSGIEGSNSHSAIINIIPVVNNDDRSVKKLNSTFHTANYANLTNEEGLTPSHIKTMKNSFSSKKIVVAENPNLKFWDIKLDISSTSIASPKENGTTIRPEKGAISSIKTKPIYHDPQNLLAVTINTKRKIQEKLKHTSFASKTSYYTAMREYNQFNLAILKRPLKSSAQKHFPIHTKQKKTKLNENVANLEIKGFDRLVQVLKTRSKFSGIDEEAQAREEKRSQSCFSSNSKRNTRNTVQGFHVKNSYNPIFEPISTGMMTTTRKYGGIGSSNSGGFKPMTPGLKQNYSQDHYRPQSVNVINPIGNTMPQLVPITGHNPNSLKNISRSNSPDFVKRQASSPNWHFGHISPIKDAIANNQATTVHRSKLLDRASSERKHFRVQSAMHDNDNDNSRDYDISNDHDNNSSFIINSQYMINQNYGNGYKQQDINIPGFKAIMKRFQDKQTLKNNNNSKLPNYENSLSGIIIGNGNNNGANTEDSTKYLKNNLDNRSISNENIPARVEASNDKKSKLKKSREKGLLIHNISSNTHTNGSLNTSFNAYQNGLLNMSFNVNQNESFSMPVNNSHNVYYNAASLNKSLNGLHNLSLNGSHNIYHNTSVNISQNAFHHQQYI